MSADRPGKERDDLEQGVLYLTVDDVFDLSAGLFRSTSTEAADQVLRINGFDVTAAQNERALWSLDLSAGLTVQELAAKIRAGLVTRGQEQIKRNPYRFRALTNGQIDRLSRWRAWGIAG